MSEAWSTYCQRFGLLPMEAKIMAVLADGKRHDREALMQEATGKQFVGEHTATVHIHRMRKKIGPHGYVIERGSKDEPGYRLVAPQTEAAAS